MENSSFLQALRQQQYAMAQQARKLGVQGVPEQAHMCECEECLGNEARRARAAQPWTSLTYAGSICAPSVLPTDPVNSVVFWNMAHVLQELCNLTTVYATPDVPAVRASTLLESLQGHATPSAARENPLVQFFDDVASTQTSKAD